MMTLRPRRGRSVDQQGAAGASTRHFRMHGPLSVLEWACPIFLESGERGAQAEPLG